MDKIPYSPGFRNRFIHQFFPSPQSNPPASPGPGSALFAVIQIGGVSVFGLGRSCDAAIHAARFALTPDVVDFETLPNFPPAPGVISSGFFLARITERFAGAVEARGGTAHLSFTVDAGGLFDLVE